MGLKEITAKSIVHSLFDIKKENFHRLDFQEKTIIMPNHTSIADAAVLAFTLPKNVVFVAHTDAIKRFSFIDKFRKIITIDNQNPASIREIIDVVNAGTPIVIFPEGRITTTGNLMKIYEGVAFIAMNTGATIYPMAINGLERSKWGYTSHLWKTTYFPDTRLTIGTPFKININEEDSKSVQRERAAKQIYDVLKNEIFFSRMKDEVNLFNELLDAAKLNGDKMTIISDATGELTYKKLILASYVFSEKLKKLLNNEHRVGLFLPNANGHAITLYALMYLGINPAVLNFSQGTQTLIDCAETVELKTIITSRAFVEKGGFQSVMDDLGNKFRILYLEDIKESITGKEKRKGFALSLKKKRSTHFNNEVILFTSGSESKPKGVALSHRNIYANIQQVRSVIDFTSRDNLFNAMPMFHSFGLTAGFFLPTISGIPCFLYPKPTDYKTIPELVYQTNATIMFGTSTFLDGYAKYASSYDFYNLRIVVAGAEKLKNEVRQEWLDKFGIRILEGYGATETAPVLSVNTPIEYEMGSVGKLLPGVEYKIEEAEGIKEGGILHVKGPNIMKGYYLYGKGFVPHEGWYNTGDIVKKSENGFISIAARFKRFAKIGGEMVSLNLVEELAQKCFNSLGFATVAVQDKKKGEQIILLSINEVSIKDFKKYLKDTKISALHSPSEIIHIEEIPLLGSGKPDYVKMKEIAEQAINAKEKKGGFFHALIKKFL